MNILHKLIAGAAAAALSLPAIAQTSVLGVSDSSMQPTVTMPSSVETDTHKMLEDWYLKNYVVLDYEADSRDGGDFSDETLTKRLAAMPTEIEMPFNSVVKNMILFYGQRKKQLVENMLGLSLYYMPIFVEALERYGLPQELKYLPVIESALVPTAVSRAGAGGLWQFMPATATGLGLEVNTIIDQRRDPYLASDAGARYLKQLYNTYNDWSLAIAAYNCGPGNVNKALRRAGEGKHDFWDIYPFLLPETRGYFPAFIAANYIMTYHKDHNISPALARRPIVVDTVHVNRRVHFEQISDVMDIPIDELRALNPQFRKDYIPGDIKPYSLVLPSLQVYAYIANEDSIVNHNAGKFARRGVVEPASGATTGRDSRGEYYDEETVVYHKVKKGETLAKIASKYGVTISSIKKNNKIGNTVKTGRTLKIKTVQRRYKPQTEEPQPDNTQVTATDSTSLVSPEQPEAAGETTDSTATVSSNVAAAFSTPAQETQPATPAPAKQTTQAKSTPKATTSTSKPAAPKAQTHTVRKGENLSKIAKRYGVTVAAIKKANNLKNDNINAGQKLKIPVK
ncbi:MAG: LysM peptidoglycan-binding domain-containing protein [Bacteroidales bacterium]|nr:LysM peptidoglycan-binding domain-containing protein [Bacteroidales bacterium]